ncbi:hypothetical protein WJX74_006203 [Apatococcus lobatus]|uniref:proline--tRNA ligase n=1 Tax=Apatococcus lobatus TaxID=904363 RepID=A0AAW1RSM6_9CHLO
MAPGVDEEAAAIENKELPPSKPEAVKKVKPPKKDKPPQGKGEKGGAMKKETKLGLAVSKSEDFHEWYRLLVLEAELISTYSVSGCYVLRPWAYQLWEAIQTWFDGEIKKLGVKNAYFPMFLTKAALEKEKDHVEGFAAEVAWVTKAGSSELEEPIAIRPTSETIIYPLYSQWIRSHRDLPLKLNQWTNCVRWEFKDPRPFLRTREFLWQEGHTAFATKPEADREVRQILDLYAMIYQDLLAVPVTKGLKTEAEKFAGGLYTTTVEGFIPDTGRGIQAGTSHCLGQKFSKMFDIGFEAVDQQRQLCWQNSWGLSTRSLGIMIMVHGDDKGLRLPPRVAPTQIVIINIPNAKLSEEARTAMASKCSELEALLRQAGVRAECDLRENYSPPWKYNHWEVKGVPLRMEIGPRDMENGTVMLARRDGKAPKEPVKFDQLLLRVPQLLEEIQNSMYTSARTEYDSCIERATTLDEFKAALDRKHMVLAPWCNGLKQEDDLGKATKTAEAMGAKSLCIPFEQPELAEGTMCFYTGELAQNWTLFGRSY